jgi:glycosyltransferase involved in cell wall biosynthesis
MLNQLKLLHLFSNWKWTGPAEHALHLVSCLKDRGHDLTFACGKPSHGVKESIIKAAEQRKIIPLTSFHLNKHFNVLENLADFIQLERFLKKNHFHIIHTHLTNDHFLGSISSRRFTQIKVIRSCYDGEELKKTWINRIIFSRLTDGVICVSEKARRSLIETFNLPADKVWKMPVPVDGERFSPEKRSEEVRSGYGIKRDEVVVGIVARVQPHRRFDVLLSAIALTIKKIPNLKLMIVGRGTHIEKVAKKPVQETGLSPYVIFTGYRGEDYVETLACLDIKVFLVPGTDGACRAVREAMATGIPVIAARRGMLPEIVDDGITGLVIEDTPENLSQAIERLVLNPGLRKQMGEKARIKALSEFSLSTFGERVEEIYRKVIEA